MAEVPLGAPHEPAFRLTNKYNEPYTSGVTGTLAVYGPASATALTSGSLTHFGDGVWGLAVGGTHHRTPGRYTYLVSEATVSDGTLYDLAGAYRVGVVLPWMAQASDLLFRLYRRLEPGGLLRRWRTSASGGDATTLKCAGLGTKTLAANALRGSQVVLLDNTVAGDPIVHEVTANSTTSGVVSLTIYPGLAGTTPANMDFLLVNVKGKGYEYSHVWDALLAVCGNARARLAGEDLLSLTYAANTWEYEVPDSFASVTAIYARSSASQPWDILPPADWSARRGARALVFQPGACVGAGDALRIDGTYWANPPAGPTSWVEIPAQYVVGEALKDLLIDRGRAADLARAASVAADPRLRWPSSPPLANEVFL